jgi:hypothetical protein
LPPYLAPYLAPQLWRFEFSEGRRGDFGENRPEKNEEMTDGKTFTGTSHSLSYGRFLPGTWSSLPVVRDRERG